MVVVGAGMIGLLTMQAARLAGAGRVIAVDVDDTRLEMARSLGATDTLNSRQRQYGRANYRADRWAAAQMWRWSAWAPRCPSSWPSIACAKAAR